MLRLLLPVASFHLAAVSSAFLVWQVHTMRNADNVKQWTMRILNVTTSVYSPAKRAKAELTE